MKPARRWAIFVALAVVLLLVSSLGALGTVTRPASGFAGGILPSHADSAVPTAVSGSTAARPVPGPSAAVVAAPPGSPLPKTGPAYGSVAETLDLLNLTLLAGNFTTVNDGIAPTAVVSDPANGELYAADVQSHTVSIVNATNDTVVGSMRFTNVPAALAVAPTKGELFVVTRSVADVPPNGTVHIIATSTQRVIATVPLNGIPTGAAFDPQNGYLYVPLLGNDSVAVVDTATHALIGMIVVGTAPDAVAYDASNGFLYVANSNSNNVTVINTTNDSFVKNVPVALDPVAIQPLDGTSYVYVADFGSSELSVIDSTTNTVVNFIGLGFAPVALAEDAAVGLVFTDSTTLNVFDAVNYRTQQVISTTTVGVGPAGLALDTASGRMFIAESQSDNLTVVTAGSRAIFGTIQLGLLPTAAAYDRASNELGVVMSDQNALWLFNATTDSRIRSIHVGVDPVAVVYDPHTECFFVANFESASVSVVNGTTNALTATVVVPAGPEGVTVATSYDYIFVADGNLGGGFALTEINGATNQVVGNLPVGSSGPISSVAFDAINGELYAGTGDNVTVVSPTSHSVVTTIPVSEVNATVSVDSASGVVLVAGTVEVVSGSSSRAPSHNLTIVDPASNQILANVTVGASPDGIDFDTQTGFAYVSSGINDTVTVVNVTAAVPAGTLNVGHGPAGIADDARGGQLFVTNPYSATLTIVTVPGIGRYPVNFTEKGLPASQSWSVTLGGRALSSTTPWITLVESDGSYNYNVTAVPGYTAAPNASSVSIRDAFATVLVTFSPLPPTFAVQFGETGLPAGTNWTVVWGAKTNITSSQPAITVQSENGTNAWKVYAAPGFVANRTQGASTVAGHPIWINITFTATSTGTTNSGSGGFGIRAYEGYGVAAAAAAVGAAVGALLGRGRRGTLDTPTSEPPADDPPSS